MGEACCLNCKYCRGDECRKAPPVRLPRRFDETATPGCRVRDETLLWGWPKVLPHDWCGAFAAAPPGACDDE